MYTFKISKSGWLTTYSNENQLRINLSNVSRIQTWISEYDIPVSVSKNSYNISFEMTSNAELSEAKQLINIKGVEQTFWGFENVFILSYFREDEWQNAISKVDEYINSN